MKTTCKNCNHSFEGNFCNICGQTAHTHEINFKTTLHELQRSLINIDKGILYTTKELFHRPGQSIREYLNGRRVKHFKPFAYIFILSTIYSLLTKVVEKSTLLSEFLGGFNIGLTNEKTDNSLDLVIKAILWMTNHYAYTTLLLLPIISFASYLCFYKAKYNYFEHLILNSFVAGQRTVVYLVILPFTYFIKDKGLNETIEIIKACLGVFLTMWIYYQFFQSTKPIKKVFLTILTYITTILLIFVPFIFIGLISILLK